MSWHPASSSSLQAGFLNCSSSTILAQIVLGCGNFLLRCGMVSSSPGFYLLDASSHPLPQYDEQKYLHRRANMGAQLCPTLYNPIDSSLPRSSVHGIFQARILLVQGIFPTQGLNLCLLHWQVGSLPPELLGQALPNVPLGTKPLLVEKHCSSSFHSSWET